MTPFQLAHQIRYLLENRCWNADAANNRVFRSVYVSPSSQADLLDRARFPLVIINDAGTEFDQGEREQLRKQEMRWDLTLVIGHEGSGSGSMLLLGGQRSAGLGSSSGRGLLEVRRELLDELASLGPSDAAGLRWGAASAAGALRVDEKNLVAQRFQFSSTVGNQREYRPPARFASSVGGGTVTLTWLAPPMTWALYRYMVRRASGSTPPATISDGTEVSLGSDLALTVADSPGSGTWSYSIWAVYDERGGAPAADATNVYSELVSVAGVSV